MQIFTKLYINHWQQACETSSRLIYLTLQGRDAEKGGREESTNVDRYSTCTGAIEAPVSISCGSWNEFKNLSAPWDKSASARATANNP